jgi:hypothetical protein
VNPRHHPVPVVSALALIVCASIAAFDATGADRARVSAHISPHPIRIGEPASIEIAVVTAPNRRVLPLVTPDELQDVQIEVVEELPVETQPANWIHRMRIRFRPRDTGKLFWPRTELSVESPDGSIEELILEPVPFEVTSILHLYPLQLAPFGARSAPPRRIDVVSHGSIALGIFMAAAALILLALLRRRIRGRPRPEPGTRKDESWTLALDELGRAAASDDPAAAANTTAAALREYMERRFGASVRARTTEELLRATPPFGATSRWPTFTALLLELDAARFSPRTGGRRHSPAPGRFTELVDRARIFVESSIPPEALR